MGFSRFVQALLQNRDEIDHFGRWPRFRFWFFFDFFPARFNFFLDHLHQCLAESSRYFFGSHFDDMLSTSAFAISSSRFPGSSFFGIWSLSASASSSAKCISSSTRTLSFAFTPARYWRVLITTLAIPTLPVFASVSCSKT